MLSKSEKSKEQISKIIVDQLKQSNASSIVGICLTEVHHPVFMYRKSDSGKLNPYLPYLKNSEKVVRR